MTHPLLVMMLDAASKRFPPADGGITILPPLPNGQRAIMAFTAHAVIAADVSKDEALKRGADGFGGALHPRVASWLAGEDEIGVNDVTLMAFGTGGKSMLQVRTDLEDHHRVRHARHVRSDVQVLGDDRGLVTLGAGLAGRSELGVETWPELHNSGAGRRLIEDALTHVREGEPVFAAVSPGNARSLRAFLACGFAPIASEVIITA